MRWLALAALTIAMTGLVACTADTGDFADETEDLGPPVSFGFPIADRSLIFQTTGVDHDPEDHDADGPIGRGICKNYDGEGFPACYDEHDGSDFLLEGGFETMDNGSNAIVAAAAGVVVSIEESQYDRCRVDGFEVTCDGHPMVGNHVILDHGDGVQSWYWHLMTDSVVVEPGDTVKCGDLLGMMGSSGNSSMPHLHFELQVDEVVFDPYAGSLSQEESWWAEQDAGDGLPGAGCTGS